MVMPDAQMALEQDFTVQTQLVQGTAHAGLCVERPGQVGKLPPRPRCARPGCPKSQQKVEPLDAAASPAVGIDRGTTYSCGGVGKNDGVEPTASAHTERLIDDAAKHPVAHASTDTVRSIGDAAKLQVARNPENTALDASAFEPLSKLMGQMLGDMVGKVLLSSQGDVSRLSTS